MLSVVVVLLVSIASLNLPNAHAVIECTDEQMLDFSKSGEKHIDGKSHRFGSPLSKLEECINGGNGNVNAKNTDGFTALMFASVHGHKSIVKALVEAGADVLAKTNNGWTAFKLVSEIGSEINMGHHSIYNILQKHQTSRLCTDEEVRLYSFNGDLKQVQACINGGSNLNGRNDMGATPLMLATFRGHSSVVAALIAGQPGAEDTPGWQGRVDVDLENNNGFTALDFATEIGHSAISEMLRQAAGRDSL